MKVTELPIAGVKLLEPQIFTDARGWSMESYSIKVFREIGINETFVQCEIAF